MRAHRRRTCALSASTSPYSAPTTCPEAAFRCDARVTTPHAPPCVTLQPPCPRACRCPAAGLLAGSRRMASCCTSARCVCSRQRLASPRATSDAPLCHNPYREAAARCCRSSSTRCTRRGCTLWRRVCAAARAHTRRRVRHERRRARQPRRRWLRRAAPLWRWRTCAARRLWTPTTRACCSCRRRARLQQRRAHRRTHTRSCDAPRRTPLAGWLLAGWVATHTRPSSGGDGLRSASGVAHFGRVAQPYTKDNNTNTFCVEETCAMRDHASSSAHARAHAVAAGAAAAAAVTAAPASSLSMFLRKNSPAR